MGSISFCEEEKWRNFFHYLSPPVFLGREKFPVFIFASFGFRGLRRVLSFSAWVNLFQGSCANSEWASRSFWDQFHFYLRRRRLGLSCTFIILKDYQAKDSRNIVVKYRTEKNLEKNILPGVIGSVARILFPLFAPSSCAFTWPLSPPKHINHFSLFERASCFRWMSWLLFFAHAQKIVCLLLHV